MYLLKKMHVSVVDNGKVEWFVLTNKTEKYSDNQRMSECMLNVNFIEKGYFLVSNEV
jgi:hypothetical protein